MNSIRRVCLRHLSVSCSILIACIVIARPVKHVYGMDVNAIEGKARQGYVAQQLELGEAYLTGKGLPRSTADAEYWYEKAASSGNAEAANMVAYMYQAGIGVAADPTRAVRWYELSAASGCSDAMINLGVLHMMGLGFPKDPARAAEYFRRGLEHGNGTGAAYLGTMAYSGIGMNRDSVAAERWFKAGQKLHDPISTYDLGVLYSTAADHAHDFKKAARYLRQAADANYVSAMQSLGVLLLHHPELDRDDGEAVRRLQAAADAGSWQASLVLGVMAHTGSGIAVDNKTAYFHFRVAMLQGGSAARALAERHTAGVIEALGQEQARAIEADADAWFQQHSGIPALVRRKGQSPKFFADPTMQAAPDILNAALPVENPAS
jgi:hypothetical protein